MQFNPTIGLETNKKVYAMNLYAYRITLRVESENHILKSSELFHQFIVNMYAKVESELLLFNQKKLLVDDNIYLKDAVANDTLEKMVILPVTFTGSPSKAYAWIRSRCIYIILFDVKNYVRPDLFYNINL